jgi:hypothetical protein
VGEPPVQAQIYGRAEATGILLYGMEIGEDGAHIFLKNCANWSRKA